MVAAGVFYCGRYYMWVNIPTDISTDWIYLYMYINICTIDRPLLPDRDAETIPWRIDGPRVSGRWQPSAPAEASCTDTNQINGNHAAGSQSRRRWDQTRPSATKVSLQLKAVFFTILPDSNWLAKCHLSQSQDQRAARAFKQFSIPKCMPKK